VIVANYTIKQKFRDTR